MTGYGREERVFKGGLLAVEVRSVNSKYCDLSLRLPKSLLPFESALRSLVQQRIARGRVEVSVSYNGDADRSRSLQLDLPLAQQYRRLLQQLKTRLKLKGEVDLALLIGLRDVISPVESVQPVAGLQQAAERAIGRALDRLEAMRAREGRALAQDSAARLKTIRTAAERIRARAPQVVADYQQRLDARVQQLAGGLKLEPARLVQEVALFAERCDITEELTRLESHLMQFDEMLARREPVGRSLDFLIQELNREVNTVGSKANDAAITREVVAVKSELDKLREQVQNIE
jgi:uncharacterized protein (TIGR00255 family)